MPPPRAKTEQNPPWMKPNSLQIITQPNRSLAEPQDIISVGKQTALKVR